MTWSCFHICMLFKQSYIVFKLKESRGAQLSNLECKRVTINIYLSYKFSLNSSLDTLHMLSRHIDVTWYRKATTDFRSFPLCVRFSSFWCMVQFPFEAEDSMTGEGSQTQHVTVFPRLSIPVMLIFTQGFRSWSLLFNFPSSVFSSGFYFLLLLTFFCKSK